MAVLVAALVNFVLGFLIHGPIAGKMWMRLAKIHPTGKEKFSDMYGQMAWNLLANLVAAYVLALFYKLFTASPFIMTTGVVQGMVIAFWCWLGFMVTSSSMEVIWMKRSFKHYAFEAVSAFVCFLAMGVVIALMG